MTRAAFAAATAVLLLCGSAVITPARTEPGITDTVPAISRVESTTGRTEPATGRIEPATSRAVAPAGAAGRPAAPADAGPPRPAGAPGDWTLTFRDEFTGTALDVSRWQDHSSAEPDQGHGNLSNQQLEWNQAANCAVSGGELVMTARRQHVRSPSGAGYDWTSCLITSSPAFTFQYGFIEERAVLPAARGFWPAFWTWPAREVAGQTETDVYEFYSDNHTRIYSTQFSGAQGRCAWTPGFDPSAGWHTYGAAIEPDGTTWYADGRPVCHTDATSAGPTGIISNLAAYATIPPDDRTSSAVKRVDYIRAWSRS